MKTILQMILARFRPVITYAGPSGKGQCYHVKMQPTATEEDVYAAKEAITHVGYTCLCYHTQHNGMPQLGVFSDN